MPASLRVGIAYDGSHIDNETLIPGRCMNQYIGRMDTDIRKYRSYV